MRTPKPKREPWGNESEQRKVRSIIERTEEGNRSVLEQFTAWLNERGLSANTITVRVDSASAFVDGVGVLLDLDGERAIRSLTADAIEDSFVAYGANHGMGARRSMQSALRLLLEFASERGWIDRELREAVPRLRGWRLSGLPVGVSENELATLLSAPWEISECVRRDRAILWLLATYGVRRGQISALCLTDIDWENRTIRFGAHKGGKPVEHELTAGAAEALASYLRHERPASESGSVFLRARSPHLRLGPGAITMIVSTRMARCGLPRRGPHAFRHAFATRLLRAGQPVKAIADLLGHRSLAAVAIYAKVDHSRLWQVAVEWPEPVML